MFIKGFTKTAFTSPHDKEVKVKATPKKHGGSSGRSKYTLRHHPEENRWSCSCPDWRYRRQSIGDKKHHDCKHILAHKLKTTPWEAKEKMGKFDPKKSE